MLVGGMIREADSRGDADSPAFQSSLAKSLSSETQVLVNPKVSEAIARANRFDTRARIAVVAACHTA